MTQSDYLAHFESILKSMLDITQRKNADYAGVEDAFKNFRLIETLKSNVSTADGILVRMTDKLTRVANLLERPAQVADEKIEDTLKDLAVYAIIMVIWLRAQPREPENA